MLLAAGARVNDQPECSTALMAAVMSQDVDFAAFLLDRGAKIESQVIVESAVASAENRPTPLMLAADRSAADVVALL
jgi:ankyrin repeat protein